MSDLPENSNKTDKMPETAPAEDNETVADTLETEEFDTIFGDPANHDDDKKGQTSKRRITAIIASFLAVAILAGGTVAVLKLIPEKKTEDKTSSFLNTITVLNNSADKFTSVTVTNSNGTFKLLPKKVEESSSSSTDSSSSSSIEWYVDGVSEDVIAKASVSAIAEASATVSATREITAKSLSECGLENPAETVKVTSDEYGEYSISVGSKSPDASGTYLKTSTSDKIYLVADADVSKFDFALMDLADNSAIPAATFSGDVSSYKTDDSETITSFDLMTISGTKFPKPVTLMPNVNDDVASYMSFYVITPVKRYANDITHALSLFTTSTTVSGVYTMDVSAQSLKKYGLDNPDVEVNIYVAGQRKTYKIKAVDDTYSAVITDDSKLIKKVQTDSINIMGDKAESFYYPNIATYNLTDLSGFKATVGAETFDFAITSETKDDETNIKVKCGNTELTDGNFQNFYYIFVGLACSEFDAEKPTATPDSTLTISFAGNKTAITFTFTKTSATRYTVCQDGVVMGKITASSYNKYIKNLKLVAQNKTVE